MKASVWNKFKWNENNEVFVSIDGLKLGNYTRFINHANERAKINAQFNPEGNVVAIRRIKKHEEILVSYGSKHRVCEHKNKKKNAPNHRDDTNNEFDRLFNQSNTSNEFKCLFNEFNQVRREEESKKRKQNDINYEKSVKRTVKLIKNLKEANNIARKLNFTQDKDLLKHADLISQHTRELIQTANEVHSYHEARRLARN